MAGEKRPAAPSDYFNACAESASAHALPSYLVFLRKMLKGSPPYAIYERFRSVYTPTIWIARILRIVRVILLFIETSAFLLVAAAVLLVLLPALLLLALAFIHTAIRERRRMNRHIAPLIVGRRVLILFGREDVANSLSLSYTVLVVTDSIPAHHPAAVACRARSGVILVREHYFFYLRRTLFSRAARVALLF